jgi:hypothetical protein
MAEPQDMHQTRRARTRTTGNAGAHTSVLFVAVMIYHENTLLKGIPRAHAMWQCAKVSYQEFAYNYDLN